METNNANEPQAGDTAAASASGEPVTSSSAPVAQAASGTTGTSENTPSSAPVSTQTGEATTAQEPAPAPTTKPDGTQGETSGESLTGTGSGMPLPDSIPPSTSDTGTTAATADAGTSSSTASTLSPSIDAQAVALAGERGSDVSNADASTPVAVIITPPTDSVNGSPTGGPIPGAGDTPDVKAKHGLLARLEADLRAELQAVEELPAHAWHVLAAVFDRHHSAVDVEAVSK